MGLSAGLTQAGLAPEEAADVLAGGPAPVRSLAAAGDGESASAERDTQPLLILGVILLYLALLTFPSATW